MTSSNKNGFIEYKLESDRGFELDKKREGTNYTYTFKITPLPYDHVNLTYFIKFTPKNDYIEGENDNCTALRESKSWIEELTNFESAAAEVGRLLSGLRKALIEKMNLINKREDDEG